MKKIFPIFAVLLLTVSMLFTACDIEESDVSEDASSNATEEKNSVYENASSNEVESESSTESGISEDTEKSEEERPVCDHEYTNACDTVCDKCSEARDVSHRTISYPYVNSTCTEPGRCGGEWCEICNEMLVEPETIPAKGHNETLIEAIEPTCTQIGFTEGKYCSVCDEVLVARKMLDTVEHIFEEYNYMSNSFTCLTCHGSYSDKVNEQLVSSCDHNFITAKTSDGKRTNICVRCGIINELSGNCTENHELTVELEPTYYNVGVKSVSCDKCGYGKIELIPPTNTGSYVCNMSLGEYADASAKQLMKLSEEIYSGCIEEGTVDWCIYPFSDISTYEKIKDFTLDLVKNEKSDYDKAKKIYTWVCENIVYDSNAGYYDLGKAWETRRGVCSQYVQLTHDMLSSIGIMSSYVSGYSTEVPWDKNTSVKLPTIFQHAYDTGHAVVACYVDSKIVVLDPTWGRVLGLEKYFDMSEEELAEYFISVEINLTKIIPENVDIRNYPDPLVRIGDHIMLLGHGKLLGISGWVTYINNLYFDFRISYGTNIDSLLIISENSPQYVNSAYRSCIIYYSSDFILVCLPDGRTINLKEFFLYANLENEKYGNDITFPLSEKYAFYDECLYQQDQGSYTLVECFSEREEITVPGEINGIKVTRIGSGAFMYNSHIKKLTIEDGIWKIESQALDYSSLKELYLPSTLVSFQYIEAYELDTIRIDEDNKFFISVGNVVYTKNGEALVYYPSGKEDKEYIVPDGVKYIVNIRYNQYLEKLSLPEGVEVVGWLLALPSLSYLDLPNSITTIHQLWGTALTEIIIPDGVTRLEGSSLPNNELMKKIVLPASLEYLASDALSGSSSLTEIIIDSGNKYFATVDGVLYTKDMKTLLVYPQNKQDEIYTVINGTETLADGAFALNYNLKEVILPSSVKVLGMAAFNTSSIERIDLNCVEDIGGACFAGCFNLKSVIIPKNVKKMAEQIFYYSSVEYIVIENPNMETAETAFLRADNLNVFLVYENITDKETLWTAFVAGVYPQDSWQYVEGVPTLLK